MAEYMEEIERQTLAAIEWAEDTGRSAARTLSALAEQTAAFMPVMPTLPFAELVPSPGHVVGTTFRVADRMVAAGRRVGEAAVEAFEPVTVKLMPWTSEGGPRKRERAASEKSRASQAA